MSPLSFVTIADKLPADGDEVTLIGSPGGLAPWSVRKGVVTRTSQYPSEAAGHPKPSSSPNTLGSRVQAEVIETDIDVTPGDSGGPLLDSEGRLIGINFAPTAKSQAVGQGLHIAVPHLQAMVTALPAVPEVVPPDFFVAADPTLVPTAPRKTIDSGFVESVVWPFLAKRDGAGQATAADVAAVVTYIDAERRSRLPENQADALAALMPRGLWSLPHQGQFSFSAAILRRADGLVAVATTNAQGIVSEIRLNREGGTSTQVAFSRDGNGKWQVSSSLIGKPLNPTEAGGREATTREAWDRAVGKSE